MRAYPNAFPRDTASSTIEACVSTHPPGSSIGPHYRSDRQTRLIVAPDLIGSMTLNSLSVKGNLRKPATGFSQNNRGQIFLICRSPSAAPDIGNFNLGSMIPGTAALLQGGNRFSEKIVLKRKLATAG
jgi:hypothetical protein